ncbi:hypothetical protein [Streptomyces sp. URMC 129]|uniref:hypothetical protein n=1 Tax=Streptomyces sp. URMC 129 TaxID=3423407 RepID=UPI003F1DDB6B
MGNWFTDLIEDTGNAIASGIEATTRGLNAVDRYINPLHVEFDPDGDVDESRNRALGNFAGDVTQRGVESFTAAYEYVYSNYVSQPLSTAILMGQRPGQLLSADEWSRTWTAAQYISPGQAFQLPYAESSLPEQILGNISNFTGTGPLLNQLGILGETGNAQQAVDSPLVRYTPPAAMLPPDWDQYSPEEQQQLLEEMGMPVDPRGGNAFIAGLRERSMGFRLISGYDDFALRWFADPVTGALKVAGQARQAATTARRPQGGWSPDDIDRLVNDSRMQRLINFLDENRDNPALVNNTDLALKSAMGPRLGAINSVLKSPDEVRDFIRVGMGDVAAAERLAQSNALAAQRMDGYRSRISVLGSNLSAYGARLPQAAQGVIRQEIERLNGAISADEALVSRYNQILEHADEIDQLHLSRWQFTAARNRTEAQRAYATGPAKDAKADAQFGRQFRRRITPVAAPEGTDILVNSGMVKTRLWGIGDAFSVPVTLVRSMKNAHPNGFLELDNGAAFRQENVTELRAQLARIPGFTGGQRQKILNDYLKTTSEGERRLFLDQLGGLAMGRIAEKYGLDPKAGLELWEATRAQRTGLADNMRQYSTAMLNRPDAPPIRVDAFENGSGVAVHPHTVSRLVNNYVLDDLEEFDKLVRRNASMFRALREGAGGARDWVSRAGDTLNQYWKFATLFRLGYIPRTIGDDIASQFAALGAATMAMRTGYGVKNLVTNTVHRSRRALEGAAVALEGRALRYVDEELAAIRPELDRVRASGGDTSGLQARVTALEDRRADMLRGIGAPRHEFKVARQGGQKVRVGDQEYPAALAGSQRAEYYAQRISPSRAYDQLFSTNRQLIHANLLRSFDNGARPISAVDDEVKHAEAWAHAINAQIAGDAMERMVVAGRSDQEIVQWLKRAPEGRDYWRRLGVESMTTPEEIVLRARTEVDEYLPLPEIRAQALTPEGVTPEFLKDAIQNPLHRPTVHMANVGQAGVTQFSGMNRIMQMWYNFAVNLPSKTLSRHPLFNQLYEGHLKTVVSQRARQGAKPRTVDEVERVAEVSRRLAERDMKRLVFDISHRSDAAAALRFISPFFSATAESFQRWARIIAEKPEVLGYAAKWYNAPAYMGSLQTANGDPIFADGTYVDPATGERKRARKNDRFIVGRLPDWLVDSPVGIAMGAERTSGNFMLSQNSINLVTQGDPWYNPGTGPIVAIPVGEFVKDKPSQAELAKHLGILPFGAPTGGTVASRALQGAAPGTLRNFLIAFDASDYRYQQVKMQIMQRAIFLHETQGAPMPTEQQIADQTRNYWLFSAASAFTQPAATQRKDAYEFYRQQYRILRDADPETADMEFLSRFGDDYFVFAQSMSKNVAGVQATNQAVELSQQYADLLGELPELGSLIIGPEGNGPFSPEAYAYQLNHPIEPGDPEAQRRRLTAREAMEENNRRRGWAQYTATMNGLTAQLVQRGLVSPEDPGAEDLLAQRQAFVHMLGEPMLPDGSANPYYNEQWSEDWFSFDARKYERLIPALERVASEVLARDPDRVDLRTLQVYLEGRRAIQQELSAREFTTLGARANADLRRRWTAFTGQLVESDTGFGDLYSRYLSRDLGVDTEEESARMAQEGALP